MNIKIKKILLMIRKIMMNQEIKKIILLNKIKMKIEKQKGNY